MWTWRPTVGRFVKLKWFLISIFAYLNVNIRRMWIYFSTLRTLNSIQSVANDFTVKFFRGFKELLGWCGRGFLRLRYFPLSKVEQESSWSNFFCEISGNWQSKILKRTSFLLLSFSYSFQDKLNEQQHMRIRTFVLRWLVTVSSTFQDLEFNGSL